MIETKYSCFVSQVQNLMKNELLLVTVGSSTKLGQVLAIKDDLTKLRLKTPVCADIGERVTFCRRINRYWRYYIY